jgi:hypothetical protein
LNTEALRIDILVIKKKPGIIIGKDFAEHFRGHNILEYKSPDDTLDVSSYLKVLGYGCLYQTVESIDYKDVTLTIVSTRRPLALLKELRAHGRLNVVEKYKGIYEIEGEAFPVRIIASKQLPESENIWLRSLNRELSMDGLTRLNEKNAGMDRSVSMAAYWDVLTNANIKIIKELAQMSRRPFDDFIKELGLDKVWEAEGIAIGEARGEAKGEAKGEKQGLENAIYIIKGLKRHIPPEQLAKESGLPIEEVERIKEEVFELNAF